MHSMAPQAQLEEREGMIALSEQAARKHLDVQGILLEPVVSLKVGGMPMMC